MNWLERMRKAVWIDPERRRDLYRHPVDEGKPMLPPSKAKRAGRDVGSAKGAITMDRIGWFGLVLMVGCFAWGIYQTTNYNPIAAGRVIAPWLIMGGIIGGISLVLVLAGRQK